MFSRKFIIDAKGKLLCDFSNISKSLIYIFYEDESSMQRCDGLEIAYKEEQFIQDKRTRTCVWYVSYQMEFRTLTYIARARNNNITTTHVEYLMDVSYTHTARVIQIEWFDFRNFSNFTLYARKPMVNGDGTGSRTNSDSARLFYMRIIRVVQKYGRVYKYDWI